MKIIVHNTTKTRNVIVVPTEISQSHAVRFPPGYSTIDEDAWKDKTVQADELEKAKYGQKELHIGAEWYAAGQIKNGNLVVLTVEEKKGDKPGKRFATLKDFDAKRVEQIIEDTHDSNVLKEWREQDDRADVRAAIMTRMEKFNKKPG